MRSARGTGRHFPEALRGRGIDRQDRRFGGLCHCDDTFYVVAGVEYGRLAQYPAGINIIGAGQYVDDLRVLADDIGLEPEKQLIRILSGAPSFHVGCSGNSGLAHGRPQL